MQHVAGAKSTWKNLFCKTGMAHEGNHHCNMSLRRVPFSWLNGAATELAHLPFLDPDGKSWLLEQAGMNIAIRVSPQIQGNHLDHRSNETKQRMSLISSGTP